MGSDFSTAYGALNQRPREAVDHIDGPLLVLAGPGTGKTQLLSTRAANIVRLGSVSAENILCLTYTEAGASEMRSRLSSVMGNAGSEVAVHTFHSFGTWLINQYPERFSEERALRPLDDLSSFQLLETLLQQLPLRHPLAVRDGGGEEHFIRQHAVREAIQAFKQSGLSPDAVRAIVNQNKQHYAQLQPLLETMFSSTLSTKRLPAIRDAVQAMPDDNDLAAVLLMSLEQAITDSETAGKTAPLGKWRTDYTTIVNARRLFKGQASQQMLLDTVQVYEHYQQALQTSGHYDYDDMVLWASRALDSDHDMQLDVAERFQYIMVDEFQDTNGAQNKLLDTLLQANPLDAPNVMVVGDDDQAIMRFQGASAGSMVDFLEQYTPQVITLQDNYRSGQPILDASRQIIIQADDRLESSAIALTGSKQLTARSKPAACNVTYNTYDTQSLEFAAIAEQVTEWLEQGVAAEQIGIIGRKHAELVQFVPFLLSRGIAVNYDRRENILEQPAIIQLLQLAHAVDVLASKPKLANNLLPQLLAAPYFEITPLELYRLAAQAREQTTSWLDTMLANEGRLRAIAEWLLAAANATHTNNFTQMLDILLGRQSLAYTELGVSPYIKTYQAQPSATKYRILAQLLELRTAVLDNRPTASTLHDLYEVATEYRRSGMYLTSTSPVLQGAANGVQVMTAHGSKGREFERVIVLSCIDETWGNRARSNNQRIRLPENLPLYAAGDTESDRLRLLYVAMTRTKQQLQLTGYAHNDNGKPTTPLSFLALGDDPSGWWQPQPQTPNQAIRQTAVEDSWLVATIDQRDTQQVLQPLLKNFRLSATALRDFLDICYSGPQACLEAHVLRFPSAYSAASALGAAVHRVLQVAQTQQTQGKPLSKAALLALFDTQLVASGLSEAELSSVRSHGHQFLPNFVAQFAKTDFPSIVQTEQYLHGELPLGKVPVSGAIDAIAEHNGSLRIIDYKTGKPPLPAWQTTGLSDYKKISLHFYRQQLLFYKLLADSSRQYSTPNPVVATAELVFVENSPETPDEFIRLSLDSFDDTEMQRVARLAHVVYNRILVADLPDITNYSRDLKGIQAFEEDLLQ